MKPLFFIFMLFLCGLSQAGAKSKAIYDLEVLEELPVHSEANLNSPIISRLNRGDKVVVSPKIYGSFRKVLITYRGKARGGFVPIAKIARSLIKERGATTSDGRKPYASEYAVGLAAVVSYLRQGESTFQQTDGEIYDTTPLQSTTFFFSVFADIPIDSGWGLRTYVALRETNFSGTVSRRNDVFATKRKVNRTQSLTGVGLIGKFYNSPGSGWWWGGGLELAMGKRITIKVDDVELPVEDTDKPFFAIAYGALGAYIPVPGFSSLFLAPDIRLGTIATTTPITLYVETFLAGSYLF